MSSLFNSENGSLGYAEQIVSVKANGKIKLIRTIILLVCAVLLFLLLSLTSKIPQIFAVWAVVIIALASIAFSYTKREFEYTIAQSTLTLDCIYGKKKRKHVFEIKLSDALKVAPANFTQQETAGIEKKNIFFACNKNDAYIHCMTYTKNNQNCALYFSAPPNVINSIKHFRKSIVSQ